MTDTSKSTPINWRALSEQTGYRVLTFPDGSTLNSCDIRHVKFHAASYDKIHDKHYPPYVTIGTPDAPAAFSIYEDVEAVLAMATAAHRQWGGREQWHGGSADNMGDDERMAYRHGRAHALANLLASPPSSARLSWHYVEGYKAGIAEHGSERQDG